MIVQPYYLKFILLFFFIIGIGDQVSSAEVSLNPARSWHASLGYGIALKNNTRKNNNYRDHHGDLVFKHIPLIQIGWGPISMGAQGLIFNFIGNREIGGYLNINRVGDRYYASNMENRKESWFFGGGLKYKKMNFLLAKDINGRSHGIKGSIHYTALYSIGEKVAVRSSAGLEFYSQSFAEYYYGVRANEAFADRFEYHPHAYWLPSISFFPGYKLSDDLHLMIGTVFKILPKTVRSSPTTNGSLLEVSMIFGASWKF